MPRVLTVGDGSVKVEKPDGKCVGTPRVTYASRSPRQFYENKKTNLERCGKKAYEKINGRNLCLACAVEYWNWRKKQGI